MRELREWMYATVGKRANADHHISANMRKEHISKDVHHVVLTIVMIDKEKEAYETYVFARLAPRGVDLERLQSIATLGINRIVSELGKETVVGTEDLFRWVVAKVLPHYRIQPVENDDLKAIVVTCDKPFPLNYRKGFHGANMQIFIPLYAIVSCFVELPFSFTEEYTQNFVAEIIDKDRCNVELVYKLVLELLKHAGSKAVHTRIQSVKGAIALSNGSWSHTIKLTVESHLEVIRLIAPMQLSCETTGKFMESILKEASKCVNE